MTNAARGPTRSERRDDLAEREALVPVELKRAFANLRRSIDDLEEMSRDMAQEAFAPNMGAGLSDNKRVQSSGGGGSPAPARETNHVFADYLSDDLPKRLGGVDRIFYEILSDLSKALMLDDHHLPRSGARRRGERKPRTGGC